MSLYIPKMSDTPAITIPGLASNFQALDGSQIVEQGSNENGEYVRWENRLQICRLLRPNLEKNLTVAWGSLFSNRSDEKESWTFPAAFSSRPTVFIACTGTQAVIPILYDSHSSTQVQSIDFQRPVSTLNARFHLNLFAIGEW